MKTKKLGRKLVLNKKTIANLRNYELGNVVGGAAGTGNNSDETCYINTCPTQCLSCFDACETELLAR